MIGFPSDHRKAIPSKIEEIVEEEDVLRGEVLYLWEDHMGWLRKACSLRL